MLNYTIFWKWRKLEEYGTFNIKTIYIINFFNNLVIPQNIMILLIDILRIANLLKGIGSIISKSLVVFLKNINYFY